MLLCVGVGLCHVASVTVSYAVTLSDVTCVDLSFGVSDIIYVSVISGTVSEMLLACQP